MKITDVKAYPLRIPMKANDLPACSPNSMTPVIVRVYTDEGINGVGEAYGFSCASITCKAVEAGLKPVLIGTNPMQIQKLWEELYRSTFYYGRMGIMLGAISGVEMALWDIVGKAKNLSVCQMLGGNSHEKLPAYASLLRYSDPKSVARACETVKQKGYTAIKLHERDVEAVAAARKAVGEGYKLMLDVTCPWDMVSAIEMGKKFEQFNLWWYEEPVWPADDYSALAKVRSRVNIPIAAGENEYTVRGFMNLINKEAVDFLQPSVFKLGGILQEKKVFTIAETFGVEVGPHCWSWGPALAATLQVSFSEPTCKMVETSADTPEDHILTEPLVPEHGFWKAPEKPGLGIELNEEVVAKYELADPDAEPAFWTR